MSIKESLERDHSNESYKRKNNFKVQQGRKKDRVYSSTRDFSFVLEVFEQFWGISFGGLLINVRNLVLIIESRFRNSPYKTSLFDGNSQSLNRTATIFETLRS